MVTLPDGWTEASRSDDTVTFLGPLGRQSASISVLQLRTSPSFEEFKRLCSHRIAAEHSIGPTVFTEVTGPLHGDAKFQFLYSGGEKSAGRIFSGYLLSRGRILTTIYVEGSKISPQDHLKTFTFFYERAEAFVAQLGQSQ